MKFNHHHVPARKDLLHFIEEHLTKGVYKALGKNPKRWIEELALITGALTGEGLCAGVGIYDPPVGSPDFQQLGKNVFLYRGEPTVLRGLWTCRETATYDFKTNQKVPHTEWTNYRLGGVAHLAINEEFGDIEPKLLVPENFEPIGRKAESKGKRPVMFFELQRQGGNITVYAKGADTSISCLYEPPSYRLTNLAHVQKTKSKTELEMTIELAEKGVKTPPVIGYYEGDVEEFLFLQKVEGKSPSEFLPQCRDEIIRQDAEMLAVLCLLGYRKQGFQDFDDKVFDGRDLHLIDVDEVVDLYSHFKRGDFRKLLVNPIDSSLREGFQREMMQMFKSSLRDAIFHYQHNLTPTFKDKENYIRTFCQKVGLDAPAKAQIRKIVTFPKYYQTTDSFMSMMCDGD